jgi:type IV fimbrial biogenesis protein FimT
LGKHATKSFEQEKTMLRKESGFTLTELFIIIAILAVLASVAIPNTIAWLPKFRLGSAARDVLSTLEGARLAAVKENTVVVVEFDVANNRYTAWRDNGAGANADNWAQDVDEPSLHSGQLSGDVRILGAPDTSFNGFPRVRFNFRGLPETQPDPPSPGGGTVTVANSEDSRVISLTVGGNSLIQ